MIRKKIITLLFLLSLTMQYHSSVARNILTDFPSLLSINLVRLAKTGQTKKEESLPKELKEQLEVLRELFSSSQIWEMYPQFAATKDVGIKLIENLSLLEAALSAIKDPDKKLQFLYTLATIAINNNRGLPFLRLLVNNGVDLNKLRYSINLGHTLLHYVVQEIPLNSLEIAQFLIENGVNPRNRGFGWESETALDTARRIRQLRQDNPGFVISNLVLDSLIQFLEDIETNTSENTQVRERAEKAREEGLITHNLAQLINRAYLDIIPDYRSGHQALL